MNGRERVLEHLAGRPVDHLPLMPITMQFAAAQAGVSYRDYCQDYRVLAQAQMQVAETFGFDYVNTMSDPAREAADCGAEVEYFENQPAALVEENALLQDKTLLAKIQAPDPHEGRRMSNGIRAVELLKSEVGTDKWVEGWIEGPCAEGADLRGLNTLMLDFYDDPGFVRDLFEFVVGMELQFARAQVDAGADMIGVGDAAASLLGPQIYGEFVWPYEKKLIEGLHAMGTRARLHICGNTSLILEDMGRLGCEIVDLDSLSTMARGREAMGEGQVLLGNINPVTVLRDGTPQQVTEALSQCHSQAGPRYIVGAGCEVPRDTPHENLQALCDYACRHSPSGSDVRP
jgi:MtaA/CmuA family methyltransferase